MPNVGTNGQQTKAWRAAAGAAAAFALLPVGYHLGVSAPAATPGSPATFATLVVGLAALGMGAYPGPQRLWRQRRAIAQGLRTTWRPLLLATAANSDRLLFAIALLHAGPWLTTVLYECWPSAMTAIAAYAAGCRGIRKSQPPGAELWLALALGLAGAGLALSGGLADGTTASLGQGSDDRHMARGAAIALAAGIMGGAYVCASREAAVRMDRYLAAPGASPRRLASDCVAYTATKLALTAALAAYAAILIATGHEAPTTATLLWGTVTGLVAVAGSLLFRQAHRWSRHDGINALMYASPPLALGALALAEGLHGRTPDVDWPSLGGGLAVITIGNAIAIRATRRQARKGNGQ